MVSFKKNNPKEAAKIISNIHHHHQAYQKKIRLPYYKQPVWGAVLTLSTSSSILLVSGTSGALGTVTTIGVRVLPSVPMEAVFTTCG